MSLYMISCDLQYLRRMEKHPSLRELLSEQKFLAAQDLFFSVVDSLGGKVDFDIADMREVHAVAALEKEVKGKRVLDIGCGSLEPYVLEDTFRERYPPFFAEMLVKLGAEVTGIDIRANLAAQYDHLVLDLTKRDWMDSLDPPYDIIAVFNLFNAPQSPFEHDASLCDRMMDDVHGLLRKEGLLIVTLRDDLFEVAHSKKQREKRVQSYVLSKKFNLIHCDGNCAWLQPL